MHAHKSSIVASLCLRADSAGIMRGQRSGPGARGSVFQGWGRGSSPRPCWLTQTVSFSNHGAVCRFACCSWPELVVGGSGRRGGSRWDSGGGRTGWWVGGGSVGLWEQVQIPLWGGGKIRPEGLRQCTDWYVDGVNWQIGSHSPLISREICI